MKYKQIILYGALSISAAMSGGCATFANKNMPEARKVSNVERNFAAALQNIRIGNESGAREKLEYVVDKPPIVGITDEALFRLAILDLRENGQGETGARKLLERLPREFPKSIWTNQAAPLLEYIQATVALRARTRELARLRSQNLSLSRDNKELRQSIERIKNLDMEMEMKIRR